MQELLDAIEYANNVKSLTLDTDSGLWTIEYKNFLTVLSSDIVETENLIDHLYNA